MIESTGCLTPESSKPDLCVWYCGLVDEIFCNTESQFMLFVFIKSTQNCSFVWKVVVGIVCSGISLGRGKIHYYSFKIFLCF